MKPLLVYYMGQYRSLPVSLDGFYMFPCEVHLGIKLLDMAIHFKSFPFFVLMDVPFSD